MEILRRAGARWPGHARLQHDLALQLLGAGQAPAAREAAERAVRGAAGTGLEPDALLVLGVAAIRTGAFEVAGGAYRRVLELLPESPAAMNGLGLVAHLGGDLDGALRWYERAIGVDPSGEEAASNRARLWVEIGRVGEALREFDRLAGAARTAGQRLAMLHEAALASNYVPGEPGEIQERHFAYGRVVTGAVAGASAPKPRERGGGVVRVGYMSGDLRAHSVAYFLLPILEAHDGSRVEATLYSTSGVRDAMTRRLEGAASRLRDISGLDDERAASLMRSDRIDVLVDLSGLTRGCRPFLLARRPAPVVCTYLGSANTTGLSAVDWRIVDAWTDPPEADGEVPIAERRWRLDRAMWAYVPPECAAAAGERAPDVEPHKGVRFVSFNAVTKLNPACLSAWARILARTADSELWLKGAEFSAASAREPVLAAVREAGVEAERVRFLPRSGTIDEHMSQYGAVDVGLDPWPYNGTTTTCDAMWMGVPVVTLVGRSHAGRVGSSLMRAVGMHLPGLEERCVARDEAGYVAAAVGLAEDAASRAGYRERLRGAFRSSWLGDAAGLARALEEAYRSMLEGARGA